MPSDQKASDQLLMSKGPGPMTKVNWRLKVNWKNKQKYFTN